MGESRNHILRDAEDGRQPDDHGDGYRQFIDHWNLGIYHGVSGLGGNLAATAGTPQSATVATAFGTALHATVTDAYGNAVSGAKQIAFADVSENLVAHRLIVKLSGISRQLLAAGKTLAADFHG